MNYIVNFFAIFSDANRRLIEHDPKYFVLLLLTGFYKLNLSKQLVTPNELPS